MRRTACVAVTLLALLGCSGEPPTIEPLSDKDLQEVPPIDFDGLKKLVADSKGRPVVVAFWSSGGKDSKAVYSELNTLCQGKEGRAPVVVAVNIDRPDDVRKTTLPFVREQKPKFANHSFKGDAMMLTQWLGTDWSGWLPAICIHDAQGRMAGKFFGSNALRQAQAQLKQ